MRVDADMCAMGPRRAPRIQLTIVTLPCETSCKGGTMRDRRSRRTWLVGLVLLWTALPRTAGARITFVQEEGVEDGHFEYSFIGDVQVSPDGRYVYATAGYPQNSVLIYARSPELGTIDEVAAVDPQAAGGVEILQFDSGGGHLYALDYLSGAIVTYARDATTGLLTRLAMVQPPTSGINQQWQGMAISPDGAHVYATSSHVGIGVYSRDASTGLLTLVDVETGFPGITAAVGVKVSPDGAHVYVACYRIDGGVVVLARDAVTGQLTAVQDIEDGDGGQPSKYRFAVDVASDGGYVYVSGFPGLAVFKRDAATGMLTRVQSTNDGMSHDIWLTADGSHAYACGNVSGIRRYARDAVTGLLTTEEGYLPLEGGFPPPAFCFGMTITPDARNLYTIVSYETEVPSPTYFYTLAAFRQTNATCAAAPLTTCQAPTVAGGSSISIHGATRPKLSWKWKGQVSAPDFGDPLGGRDRRRAVRLR